MQLKLVNYFVLFFCLSLPLVMYTNLMATKFRLIIKELRESVNVNVVFFKTLPTRPLPLLSLYKNVKFIYKYNVHMFTRHQRPAFLLTLDVLPLVLPLTFCNVHMFTHVHKR